MGKAISTIIKSVSEVDPEDQKLAKDSLNSLMDLAKVQLENFNKKIIMSGTTADKLIPINKVIKAESVIRANAAKDANSLKNDMSSIVDNFVGGSTKEGVKDLFSVGITALFDSMSGSSNQVEKYVIAIGPLGGLYRIDYYLYTYQFTAKKLVENVENVVVVSLVISSIETKDLDTNTLRVIIQNTYTESNLELMEKIYKDCVEQLNLLHREKKMIAS